MIERNELLGDLAAWSEQGRSFHGDRELADRIFLATGWRSVCRRWRPSRRPPAANKTASSAACHCLPHSAVSCISLHTGRLHICIDSDSELAGQSHTFVDSGETFVSECETTETVGFEPTARRYELRAPDSQSGVFSRSTTFPSKVQRRPPVRKMNGRPRVR